MKLSNTILIFTGLSVLVLLILCALFIAAFEPKSLSILVASLFWSWPTIFGILNHKGVSSSPNSLWGALGVLTALLIGYATLELFNYKTFRFEPIPFIFLSFVGVCLSVGWFKLFYYKNVELIKENRAKPIYLVLFTIVVIAFVFLHK